MPRSGSRVRVPSRALFIYKRYPKRIPFVYKRVLPDSNGSRSPLCSGRCRTDIHRMSCTVSRSNRKKLELIYARVLPDSNGSRSPLCSGRCRTDIYRMSCTVSHSNRKKLESIYMQESCRIRMFKGRIVFFCFIRDEGVAGVVFLRNKSTYWPLAWLVLNSETHV